MAEGPNPSEPPRITINALFSLQVVALMITITVWIIRLGDKVEHHEKQLKLEGKKNLNYDTRLYLLEEKNKLKHLYMKDEGEE